MNADFFIERFIMNDLMHKKIDSSAYNMLLRSELGNLDQQELAHLEKEFVNYKQQFPLLEMSEMKEINGFSQAVSSAYFLNLL